MADKKIRKLVILAKIETTRGVDATPTGAQAMQVSNVTLTPLEGDEAEHDYVRPYFGNSGSTLVTAYSKIAFSVELSGAGAPGTAPGYAALLRACGCSATVAAGVSVTFAPVSDGLESVTIYGNVDGTNHIMRSAMGTAKIAADAKGIPKLQFEFTGLFTPLAGAPLPTPTYTAFLDAVAVNKANTTVSLHSISCATSQIGLDLGLTVVKRDLTNVDAVDITGRKSSASLSFDNVDLATKDWVGAAQLGAKGPLHIVHGTVAGNIVEITAPLAQLKKPSYADSDGVQTISMPLALVPTSAGNDEWSIVVR